VPLLVPYFIPGDVIPINAPCIAQLTHKDGTPRCGVCTHAATGLDVSKLKTNTIDKIISGDASKQVDTSEPQLAHYCMEERQSYRQLCDNLVARDAAAAKQPVNDDKDKDIDGKVDDKDDSVTAHVDHHVGWTSAWTAAKLQIQNCTPERFFKKYMIR
jgi:hypothetical protein